MSQFQPFTGMMLGGQAARAEAYNAERQAGRAQALEIIRLCTEAGRREMIVWCLIDALTIDQVRAVLAAFERPH